MLVGDPRELLFEVLLMSFGRGLLLRDQPDIMIELLQRELGIDNLLLFSLEISLEIGELVVTCDQSGSLGFRLGFGSFVIALEEP